MDYDSWLHSVLFWIKKNRQNNLIPEGIKLVRGNEECEKIISSLHLPLRRADVDYVELHPEWDHRFGYIIGTISRAMTPEKRRYLVANIHGKLLREIPQVRQRPPKGRMGHLIEGYGPVDLNVVCEVYATHPAGGSGEYSTRQVEIPLPISRRRYKFSIPSKLDLPKVRLDIDGPSIGMNLVRIFVSDPSDKSMVATIEFEFQKEGELKIRTLPHVAKGKPFGGGPIPAKDEITRLAEGKKLVDLKNLLSITQGQLGTLLNPQNPIPLSTLYSWEGGKVSIPSSISERMESLYRDLLKK